jgi:hypothetical protein
MILIVVMPAHFVKRADGEKNEGRRVAPTALVCLMRLAVF